MSEPVKHTDNIAPVTLDYTDSNSNYDVVPYVGSSYSTTHPEHLYALAHLRGIKSAPMENMRVLEIGCSTGGNILPIAARYAGAEFVGIDPSEQQIKMAKKNAEDAHIKNCQFYDIAADSLTDKHGKFDYILCHGVFSWITDEARDSILAAFANHLNDNGVAVVSYNCRPGWNILKTVRDLSVFHTGHIRDPLLAIQQVRCAIEFIGENAIGNKIYSEYLQNHAKTLKNHADHYICHEHLEIENVPMYFHEFMSLAQGHGLNYVCETGDNYSEELSAFKPAAQKFLSTVRDRVIRDQYIDYLINRQFRSTVLCLRDCKPAAEVQKESLGNLFYRPAYKLEEKEEDGKKILVARGNSFGFVVQNNLLESFLRTLLDSAGVPLDSAGWVKATKAKYTDIGDDEETLHNYLMGHLPVLLRKCFLKFWPQRPPLADSIDDKPQAFFYVRHLSSAQGEGQGGNRMCNYFGETINLIVHPREYSPLSVLLPLLDGAHSRADLLAVLRSAFLAGDLLFPNKLTAEILGQYKEGETVPSYRTAEKIAVVQRLTAEQLDNIVARMLDMHLRNLLQQHILVR